MILIGPSLEEMKRQAKRSILAHFTRLADDARPAGLAASDALKLLEAAQVLAGGDGPLIHAEAALRGITAEDHAQAVQAAAAETTRRRELARIQAQLDVERAGSASAVVQVLLLAGVELIPFAIDPTA